MKSGIRTSEFWITALSVVAATVLLLADKITAVLWQQVTLGSSTAYAVSRTVVKRTEAKQAEPYPDGVQDEEL